MAAVPSRSLEFHRRKLIDNEMRDSIIPLPNGVQMAMHAESIGFDF